MAGGAPQMGTPMAPRMTRERVSEALQTLQKYKAGKKNLEDRVIACDKWWQMRNWQEIQQGNRYETHPVSAWLFNTLATKHADAMDSYPEANILPREQTDEQEAEALKDIPGTDSRRRTAGWRSRSSRAARGSTACSGTGKSTTAWGTYPSAG